MKDQNWTEESIAAAQRKLVDEQLTAMHDNKAPAHFAVIANVVSWLKEEGVEVASLLDAGCASAYYHEIIEYYHPGWCDYTGVDFNEAMLTLAESLYPSIALVKSDLRAIKLPDRAFDVVMSGAALMHIRDWRDALGELMRVSNEWLLLHRTWVYVDGSETTIATGDAYGHPVWFLRFGEDELVSLCEKGGFTLVNQWDSGEGQAVYTYLFKRDDG